jgi:hypothetical protein
VAPSTAKRTDVGACTKTHTAAMFYRGLNNNRFTPK